MDGWGGHSHKHICMHMCKHVYPCIHVPLCTQQTIPHCKTQSFPTPSRGLHGGPPGVWMSVPPLLPSTGARVRQQQQKQSGSLRVTILRQGVASIRTGIGCHASGGGLQLWWASWQIFWRFVCQNTWVGRMQGAVVVSPLLWRVCRWGGLLWVTRVTLPYARVCQKMCKFFILTTVSRWHLHYIVITMQLSREQLKFWEDNGAYRQATRCLMCSKSSFLLLVHPQWHPTHDYTPTGYLVLNDFASSEQLAALKQRAEAIVDDFDPSAVSIFSTRKQVGMLLH